MAQNTKSAKAEKPWYKGTGLNLGWRGRCSSFCTIPLSRVTSAHSFELRKPTQQNWLKEKGTCVPQGLLLPCTSIHIPQESMENSKKGSLLSPRMKCGKEPQRLTAYLYITSNSLLPVIGKPKTCSPLATWHRLTTANGPSKPAVLQSL